MKDGLFDVGEHHFDISGIERVSNRWGFNSFATIEGAKENLPRRGHWWIWRLPDGTFNYSAVPDPRTPPAEKELVEDVRFDRGSMSTNREGR